ncbi:MAG TPA: hypothetical protein DD400_05665 [Rhodospirillaceae bacterium]|nr:hypothetical protein [Rhodospirillaceae bacterium]
MVERLQDANAFDTRAALDGLVPAGTSLDHAVFDSRNGTIIAQIKEPQANMGFDQFVSMGGAQDATLANQISNTEALLGAAPQEFASPAQERVSTSTIGANRANTAVRAERQPDGMSFAPIGASFGRKTSTRNVQRFSAQAPNFAPRLRGPKTIREYRALERHLKTLRNQQAFLRVRQQMPMPAANGFSPTVTRTVAERAAPSSRLNTFVTNNHNRPIGFTQRPHGHYEELNAALAAKHEEELKIRAKKTKELEAQNEKIKMDRKAEEAPLRRATRDYNRSLIKNAAKVSFISLVI